MTSHAFRRGHVGAEGEITHKCANSHGEHDPAIVSHEKKPTTCQYRNAASESYQLTL